MRADRAKDSCDSRGSVEDIRVRLVLLLHILLRFNLVKVEIRELRPEVIAEGDEVLVHYRSRTNVRRGLSTKTLAQVDRRTREHL